MLKINVVNKYNEFTQLKEQWNNLLMKSLHPLIFLTHQWIDVWWKAFGERKNLFVLLVYDGDKLVAIAPFMIYDDIHTLIGKTNTTLNLKKISLIANVHSNRSDLILGHNPTEACNAIIDFLLNEYKNFWELLSLEYLLKSSPTIKYIKNSLNKNNIRNKQYFLMSTPYVPINCRWENYFKNLQPRFRRSLVSRLKKLEEFGRVKLITYRSIDNLRNVLEEVFGVASKSWKAREGTAISSTPQLREFYTELAYTAAKENWLELFVFYLEEKPLVFDYCLKFENKLFDLKTEFDESFRPYGVGNIIKWKQLESIFECGLTEFDFLGPSVPWKTYWSNNNEREHVILYAFNRNSKGRLLNFMYGTKDAVKKLLGKNDRVS